MIYLTKEKLSGTGRSKLGLAVRLCIISVFIVSTLAGCTNNPYREEEAGENIFYTTFVEPPKHLDPARAYSSDEYEFIGQVYEPPLQYHFLIRPYSLAPLTADYVPTPKYYDKDMKRLPEPAPPEKVHRAVYEINVKKGIKFQAHPGLARDPKGALVYANVKDGDLEGITEVNDFPIKGTRELKADDFIYQIMRLADPQIESPVISILEKYILGLEDYAKALRKDLSEERARRKALAGTSYNQMLDERENPIRLDYKKHPLPGVEKVDDHTFRIILKTKYPQFVYWLAMPFFSPIPEEVADFYKQGALAQRNITIDRYPIGTGPYMVDVFNPNMEITLARNPNFRDERYPDIGETEDKAAGLLDDAGKRLPFIEKVVFKLEKEAIPRWNKFLQGYYDNSGITSESFDQAVMVSAVGKAEPTDAMKDKGIRLITSVRPSSYYSGFNMLDDVVGGYSAEKQKLRQAISIALDFEEYIEVFQNGRGIPAHSPIPPSIFGHLEGKDGINPYVYDWDETRGKAVRKSIDYARKLMAEAGYPGGRDKNGRPLVITFDNPWVGADSTPMINWYIKRFKLLGIQLENRTTDYNRFQEKMLKGNFQFFSWGWNADYPDPENFFFLLTGSNSKVKFGGENVSNYSNAEFDRLFKMMENMDNGPDRLKVIAQMTGMLRKDSPWVWGYHPVAFGLYHRWVQNVKPNAMANNTIKYISLDAEERKALREEWNQPNVWPIAVILGILVIGSIPAIISVRRKRAGRRRT